MRVPDLKVNIIGLSQKSHLFEYELGSEFFEHYGRALLESGHFIAEVELDKRETLIQASFRIKGHAHLVCDRSLEPFDYPMDIGRKIVFQYGPEEKELSDDMVLIRHDRIKLDLGQYVYELIGVNIPMKRLHPKFQKEDLEESDIQLIYSSPVEKTETEGDDIDPRWEKLKKLK